MTALSILLAAAIRVVLVMLFLPFSACDKIFNFQGAVRQAGEVIPNRTLAAGMIVLGLAVEIFMSIGVVTGIADRACAFALGGYCVVTALLWKQFWKPGDFWANASGQGRTLFWDFLKNLALAAGFMLVTFGTSAVAIERFIEHPTVSSHPYRLGAEDSLR